MFVNIFLLSLLTIIYGTKGDEGGGNSIERNTVHYQPDVSRQRFNDGENKSFWSSLKHFLTLNNFRIRQDLNFIKTARSIRTPFRNTEIMTARGFGKRGGEEQEFNENYSESN